jgi:hypothetical protein
MRLLTGQPAPLAEAAREYLAEVEESGSVVLVSNLVVSEAYFACQHHYQMPKADVLAGLLTILAQPMRLAIINLVGLPKLLLGGNAGKRPSRGDSSPQIRTS